MLEILFLVFLASRIGKIVEPKGYKSGKYKLILIGLWFAGEIAGLLVGILLTGGDDSLSTVAYVIALLGAFIGALGAFLIASRLKQKASTPSSAQYTV